MPVDLFEGEREGENGEEEKQPREADVNSPEYVLCCTELARL